MLINAIRNHCAEFGMIAPLGAYRASDLVEQVRKAEASILPDLKVLPAARDAKEWKEL